MIIKKSSSPQASRQTSSRTATCRTDCHLMLPSGLLLYFEPVSLLFFQNKAIGGKRKQSGRVPFGSSLGAIGGGPAVEEEEGLLLKLIEITWSA